MRMNFVVKSLAQKNDLGHYIFSDMDHLVHIDEKWFYVDDLDCTYYCLDGETPPKRPSSSRRFLTKVMFLCAVARPRENFDGKIGIWPIV